MERGSEGGVGNLPVGVTDAIEADFKRIAPRAPPPASAGVELQLPVLLCWFAEISKRSGIHDGGVDPRGIAGGMEPDCRYTCGAQGVAQRL